MLREIIYFMALCVIAGLLCGLGAQLQLDDLIIRSAMQALIDALPLQ